MEDVLDVYTRPYDPQRPLVCMDESPKQLVGEARAAVPTAPGRAARYDYEYVRKGVANVFLFFEPLAGQRRVKVTERRTRIEWAAGGRELVDQVHPEAEKIVLVMDQLNTHSAASLYEAFPPAEANPNPARPKPRPSAAITASAAPSALPKNTSARFTGCAIR